MSRLTDLLAQVKNKDSQLGQELEREFKVLASRRSFGLNFERHRPEAVELPQRPVRTGDKVRVLPERGSTKKGDQHLWIVKSLKQTKKGVSATVSVRFGEGENTKVVPVDDLVVVAEFQDYIYPGLVSTGKVDRGGNKPTHTVINGENFHALKALTYTHSGKIDAIYIDPPYNTGAKDWKYNNDYVDGEDLYRHSKWLAMMERRLRIAKNLLATDGILVVTVDEHEVHRLGVLVDQLFPEFSKQTVTIVNNPKGVTQGYLSRVEEYAIFCFSPTSSVSPCPDDLLFQNKKEINSELERPRWKGLLRSGDEAQRQDREKMFYPIWLNPKTRKIKSAGEWLPLAEDPQFDLVDKEGNIPAWPIRKNGSLGRWSIGADTCNRLIKRGLVAAGMFDKKRNTYGFSYLSQQLQAQLDEGLLTVLSRDAVTGVADVVWVDESIKKVRTVWHRSSHDAGAHGTDLLKNFLGPNRTFPFPKSLYAVEDSLRIAVGAKPEAIVLDFFSGSGTTAHAVMRLNHQDGGTRQSILVTNNEVGPDEQQDLRKKGFRPGDREWERLGICNFITIPRIRAAITGKTPDGKKVKGAYRFTDEFPMAEGFSENAEFFTLTYESPVSISHNRAFQQIAPLLWMRAGSQGERIDKIPSKGWSVVETYGILTDLDSSSAFCEAVSKSNTVRVAFIVTNDDRRFQAVCRRIPAQVEPVRLYESYLTNFKFTSGD